MTHKCLSDSELVFLVESQIDGGLPDCADCAGRLLWLRGFVAVSDAWNIEDHRALGSRSSLELVAEASQPHPLIEGANRTWRGILEVGVSTVVNAGFSFIDYLSPNPYFGLSLPVATRGQHGRMPGELDPSVIESATDQGIVVRVQRQERRLLVDLFGYPKALALPEILIIGVPNGNSMTHHPKVVQYDDILETVDLKLSVEVESDRAIVLLQ